MSSNRHELETLIEARLEAGSIELPVFPSSAREVLTLCEAPDVDAKKLAEVIRRDGTVAGHYLALANSAAFGSGRTPLVTLQQALTRLGTVHTKQIAVLIACRTSAFVVPDRPMAAAAMLSHAFATALFAQEIARARRLNVEEGFLAGLLHDIGTPAALQICFEVQKEARVRFDADVVDACTARFHERIGGMIATSWSMRGPIVEAIAGHHTPSKKPALAIVQLADELATGARDVARHPAADVLNLYPDDIARLVAKVESLSNTERVAA